ncbi:MAG TPA: LuxR C-terminal-related transcriptional regulator [Actinocrinis sp.]|jgi:two-component system nitrate/nitrite response regulator NarL
MPAELGPNDASDHAGGPGEPGTAGLLIVIGNDLVRHGVISILRDIDLIGEVWACATGPEAVALLVARRPGVVLCTGSNEFAPQIVARAAAYGGRVLLLLDDDDPCSVDEQAMLGAHGFLLQGETTAEALRSAVSRLASGETLVQGRPARPLPARWQGGSAVTESETEIMALFGRGMSTDRIARRLAISEHGVKRHVTSLMGKLATHVDETAADAYAQDEAESAALWAAQSGRFGQRSRSFARRIVISRPGSGSPREAPGSRRDRYGRALTGAARHARRAARAAHRAAILTLAQPEAPRDAP